MKTWDELIEEARAEERADRQRDRELAGRHSRSQAMQTNPRWPGAPGVDLAVGVVSVPITLTRKSIGQAVAIQQEQNQVNESIEKVTGRFMGVNRAAFDAQVKKRAAAHGLSSPFPKNRDRFDPNVTDDSDAGDSMLSECCKNGDLEHLTAARKAIDAEIAKRGGGVAQHFRFSK
jgi:hypothetical protein